MPRRKRRKQQIDPRLLNKESAAIYLGISVEMFERHFKLPTIRIGRRNLFDVKDLDREIEEAKDNGGELVNPETRDPDYMLRLFDLRQGRE